MKPFVCLVIHFVVVFLYLGTFAFSQWSNLCVWVRKGVCMCVCMWLHMPVLMFVCHMCVYFGKWNCSKRCDNIFYRQNKHGLLCIYFWKLQLTHMHSKRKEGNSFRFDHQTGKKINLLFDVFNQNRMNNAFNPIAKAKIRTEVNAEVNQWPIKLMWWPIKYSKNADFSFKLCVLAWMCVLELYFPFYIM